MRFQRNITLLFGQMELVVVELDAGAEVGGGASSSSMSRVASTTCQGREHPW
jgi:hypothetical protein